MGRYYSGDIEGKFWFGVQSSTDADFFGGYDKASDRVIYEFEEEQIPEVEEGIKKCLEALGENKEKLDKFFTEVNSYSDDMVAGALKITESEVTPILEWYARLELGQKILNSLKEKGRCHFEGEA